MRKFSAGKALADFDRVAHIYRWGEYLALGPLLQRTRTTLLSELAPATTALVLGDGDGRFTAALLRRRPDVRVLAVDCSRAMLALLERRCSFAANRLTLREADVRALAPVVASLPPPDLVATHFLLDCLTQAEVNQLAGKLAAVLPEHGQWLISEFAVPRRQPWRLLGALYVRTLYAAFRVLTGLHTQRLPEIGPALTAAGFERLHRTERLQGLLYSELWQRNSHPRGDQAR